MLNRIIRCEKLSYGQNIIRYYAKGGKRVWICQRSVNLQTLENTELEIHGRHDPCIVPRAVPVIESAVALGLLDLMM